MRQFFALCASFSIAISIGNIAYAQSNACVDLRNQLASLPSAGGGVLAQQQQSEIRKARGDLARLRCDSGETANNAQRLNQCETISSALSAMESNYARLSRSGGGDPYAKQRANLVEQINRECSKPQRVEQPQNTPFASSHESPRAGRAESKYQAPPTAAAENQSSEADFLSWIFGRIKPGQNSGVTQHNQPQQNNTNQFQDPNLDPNTPPKIGGGIRTVCVRTCDGYYWPVSFSSSQSLFDRDESICENMCPTQTTQLFYHYNQGQWSEDMVNAEGSPYKSMSYAFSYREKYNPECACRVLKQPEGASPLNKAKQPSPTNTKLESPLAINPAKSIEKPFIPNATVEKAKQDTAIKPLEKSPPNPFMPEISTPHSSNILRSPDNLGISVQSGGSGVKYNADAITQVPKAP